LYINNHFDHITIIITKTIAKLKNTTRWKLEFTSWIVEAWVYGSFFSRGGLPTVREEIGDSASGSLVVVWCPTGGRKWNDSSSHQPATATTMSGRGRKMKVCFGFFWLN